MRFSAPSGTALLIPAPGPQEQQLLLFLPRGLEKRVRELLGKEIVQENLRGFAIGNTTFAELEPILKPISSRVNGGTDRQASLLVHLHDLGGNYAAGTRHSRVADLPIEN